MEHTSSGTYVVNQDFDIISYNETAKSIYPQLQLHKKCYNVLMGLDEPCGPCPIVNKVLGPRTYRDPIRNIIETVDSVEIPVEGHGICHALVFSTVGDDAQYAATLPINASELKTLSLIKALTNDYSDVYGINIHTRKMTIFRQNGLAIGVNKGFEDQLDYDTLMNVYISNNVYENDREVFKLQMNLDYIISQLKESESYTCHYRVFRDGELHYFYVHLVRMGDGDTFENIVFGFANEDAAVLQRMESQRIASLLNKVESDSVTGLYTKEAFIRYTENLLEVSNEEFDFVLMKLDNLSSINYQFGRNIGTRVLHSIGTILQDYITDDTIIAHIGSGNFISLSKSLDYDIRMNDIQSFNQKVSNLSEVKDLSIKWVHYNRIPHDHSVEELYEAMQSTLSYIDTRAGQNLIVFDENVKNRLKQEHRIETGLEDALLNNEFEVWFQPKYSTKGKNDIVGAEALVRWRLPDGRMEPPMNFIPILERSGKIYKLDYYVFEKVCQIQKDLASKGIHNFPISVNLSRASMYGEAVPRRFKELVDLYQVNPKNIPIEITESSAVRAISVKEFAKTLIDFGFVLHMDDFGSGYSSLASLQLLPFETIKIDKSLIDFIGSENGENLLKHTIAFAKESGLKIVAEGVEVLEQFMFLKILGCDSIQGYYFSPPIDTSSFYNKLGCEL